jgi:hypothetical protein
MKIEKLALVLLFVAVLLDCTSGDPLKKKRKKQKVRRYSKKPSISSSSLPEESFTEPESLPEESLTEQSFSVPEASIPSGPGASGPLDPSASESPCMCYFITLFILQS